jgi:hypothetical protein
VGNFSDRHRGISKIAGNLELTRSDSPDSPLALALTSYMTARAG